MACQLTLTDGVRYRCPLSVRDRRALFAEWCEANPELLSRIEQKALALAAMGHRLEMLAKPAFELCGQTMQAFSDRAAAINRAVEDLLGDVASHAIKSGLSYDVGDIMSGRGFSDFDKFATDESKTLLAVNLAYDALNLVPTPPQGGDAS